MSDLIKRMDAIIARQVEPSGEWSYSTRSGYSQAATDCARNILAIPSADLLTTEREANAAACEAIAATFNARGMGREAIAATTCAAAIRGREGV